MLNLDEMFLNFLLNWLMAVMLFLTLKFFLCLEHPKYKFSVTVLFKKIFLNFKECVFWIFTISNKLMTLILCVAFHLSRTPKRKKKIKSRLLCWIKFWVPNNIELIKGRDISSGFILVSSWLPEFLSNQEDKLNRLL